MPRTIEYLSPTSIALFEKDKEEFYINYISDNRPPRDPQNNAMSIGSAFDAYVKSYLHESLFGKDHGNAGKFSFNTIFESQVEAQNRDLARVHGKYCFEQYKASGALADLFLELQSSSSEPRMEFEVRGVVNHYREGSETIIDDVTLLGKPDVSYVSKDGALVILDFKVNGFYSKRNTSPVAHYIRLRGAGKTNYGAHKDAFAIDYKGMKINCATTLDVVKLDWAKQLSIYAWILGGGVGGDFIIAVDQIICNPVEGALPTIKVAEHRSKINSEFQKKFFSKIVEIWACTHSGHFFTEVSLEDSIERCNTLDGRLFGNVIEDDWFHEVTKKRSY